jgi:hypothetical protein
MSSIDGDKIQWPDFTELGDLPVRVHRAKIAEVISYFGGGTSQRVAVRGQASFGSMPRQALLTQRT